MKSEGPMNSELRQKTIEESTKVYEVQPGTRIIEYQPGNGTRYVLVITDLSAVGDGLKCIGREGGDRVFMVATLNGGCGTAMTCGGGEFLHYRYVREKLDVSEIDSVVLAEAIAYFCGLEAVSCEDYEAQV